ncbi:MAG: glycosyltransferase, partial [Candidatus Thermoplasmatota archaeon]
HGYKRKGIHLLVEALGRLGAERFRLVRVGPQTDPAYIAAYRARAAELGLDLVECGVVPEDALPSYYAHADLLVFPSADEGAGLPPLEAMASGTNVVASDIPTHREMCGDLAFYASADPSSLAKAIEDALARPRPPEMLRAHAEEHSWARTADVYMPLFKELGVAGIP